MRDRNHQFIWVVYAIAILTWEFRIIQTEMTHQCLECWWWKNASQEAYPKYILGWTRGCLRESDFPSLNPILCISNAVDPTVNKASRDTTTNGWYEPSPHCRLIIGFNTLLTNQATPWKKPDVFFYCNKSMAAVQNLMFKLRGFART